MKYLSRDVTRSQLHSPHPSTLEEKKLLLIKHSRGILRQWLQIKQSKELNILIPCSHQKNNNPSVVTIFFFPTCWRCGQVHGAVWVRGITLSKIQWNSQVVRFACGYFPLIRCSAFVSHQKQTWKLHPPKREKNEAASTTAASVNTALYVCLLQIIFVFKSCAFFSNETATWFTLLPIIPVVTVSSSTSLDLFTPVPLQRQLSVKQVCQTKLNAQER